MNEGKDSTLPVVAQRRNDVSVLSCDSAEPMGLPTVLPTVAMSNPSDAPVAYANGDHEGITASVCAAVAAGLSQVKGQLPDGCQIMVQIPMRVIPAMVLPEQVRVLVKQTS